MKPRTFVPTHTFPAGVGYDMDTGGFRRATVSEPVMVTEASPRPGHVRCYTATGEYRHTRRDLLTALTDTR